ncbi:MAG: glycosyltransferase [Muribaculaceae bacterium]|nr:glycosyltransferase [Muribaculaceae bacterium]
MALTLDVAIATHTPGGIQRIVGMNLPQVDGVRYVVSWQEHKGFPLPNQIAERKDIEVFRLDEKGLSINRNNALSKCSGDIILIADDDVAYSVEGLNIVRNTFEQNPRLDVATFKSDSDKNRVYPQSITVLRRKLPKGYYVRSIEIAFRRRTAGHLRFHPELGAGVPKLQSGEDEMVLHAAINRHLHCEFFPYIICNHSGLSTGAKPTASSLRGAGCVIALRYPLSCVLRLPLKAWRVKNNYKISFFKSIYYLIDGAFCAPGIYCRGKQYL